VRLTFSLTKSEKNSKIGLGNGEKVEIWDAETRFPFCHSIANKGKKRRLFK
jgi:hypothetical protein